MESTNLHNHNHNHNHQHHHHHQHHHQLQGQHDASSTSSSSLVATMPSWYIPSNNLHAWTPNSHSLNTTNYFNNNNNENFNEENLCSNNSTPTTTTSTSSMVQDLGFQYWTSTNNIDHHQTHRYPKFTEMLSSSTTAEDQFHQYDHDNHCASFGGIFGINNNSHYNIPSRGNFSQIFPTINISSLKNNNNTAARASSSEHTSNSFDINLQALDLLTSSRFNRTFSEPSAHSLALLKENHSFAPHSVHQSITASSDSYKISPPFINGNTEAKRPNNTVMESKPSQAPAKKSRLETRACPPFKVRKEKLGDRITSLQQLVAPFGKTDTASVLMEAIGYIKFLQNQVETLSVPYMKSSRNKGNSAPKQGQTGDGNEEKRRDLRSRGLCLVPLSCLSYVTNDGGGGFWPHSDYHGCT